MPVNDVPFFGKINVDPSWKIAVLRSIWHPECTGELAKTAKEELLRLGIKNENIIEADAPGSFELPILAKAAIEGKGVHGVIAFGVIVQGKTHHARLIAEQAAAGLMSLSLEKNTPIAFEVIFVERIEDARIRSVGEHGKGPLAARTLLTCLARKHELH